MGFEQVIDLDCATSTAIGGRDKKSGKANPTQAEGYFLGTRQVASKLSQSGFANLHVLQTPNGNLGIWGKKDMDTKLKDVAPGTMVRITFVGMQPTKKQDMYKYKVEQDKSNRLDMGSLAVGDGETDTGFTDNGTSDYAAEEEEADDLDDAPPADEAPAARAQPPRQPAKAPDAARQAKVQEMLNKARAAKTAR